MNLKITSTNIVLKIVFVFLLFSFQINAQTSTSYDFNTAGQLSSLFNGVGQVESVSQLTTGGIGNSGGINLPSSANAIFSTKEGYSLGPAGSSDTFESFIQSVGNSGYSGVGFTASVPVSASTDGYYRPTDAIGISAHGGGFIFHNGATNYTGNWDGTGLSAGITATKASSVWDLLNNGSASNWYKLIFKMTRATLSTFDLRVEIWISDANGTMLDATAAAIFEVKDVTNADLANAPILHSYFNFSGYRVTNFDNFKVNLTGGGSVIQAGAPVVLTSSGSENNGTITANGNVTSENGGTVTERGFVYATTVDPTTANTKVVSGSGLGTFTGTISGLSTATTYYLRAYAINSSGTTSYGSDLSFTTAGAVAVFGLNRYGELTSDDVFHLNTYGEIGVSSLTRYAKSVFYLPKYSGAAVLVFSTETIANLTSTIAATGGKSITARGICWSTTANPTIADNKTVDGSGKGSFNSEITGLTKATTYYVRTYATNDVGTSYSTEMSFTTPTLLAVGDTYQGGKVAYILGAGDVGYDPYEQHGLIAAVSNQSTGAQWGCSGTIISGTSSAIGTGRANTTAILNGCSELGIAARVCDDYSITVNDITYSDWYLPSYEELNLLYSNRLAIGGFVDAYYWSSSETDDLYACRKLFSYGNRYCNRPKTDALYVRAIRSF